MGVRLFFLSIRQKKRRERERERAKRFMRSVIHSIAYFVIHTKLLLNTMPIYIRMILFWP